MAFPLFVHRRDVSPRSVSRVKRRVPREKRFRLFLRRHHDRRLLLYHNTISLQGVQHVLWLCIFYVTSLCTITYRGTDGIFATVDCFSVLVPQGSELFDWISWRQMKQREERKGLNWYSVMSCSYFFEVWDKSVVTAQKRKLNNVFGIFPAGCHQYSLSLLLAIVLWMWPLQAPRDLRGSDKAFLPKIHA